MEITLLAFLAIAALAFICEYVDSSLGMGYGTTLTPLLLIAGFSPLQIVPAVLLSEFLTGIVAGLWHHRFGNIRLDFRRDESLDSGHPVKRLIGKLGWLGYIPRSRDSKVILVLAFCGTVGVLVAVFVAVSIPKFVLKTYIGAMVLAMGILILMTKDREFAFSWKRLIAVGLLSSFNKGISGGGYGPLVTGGQILSGRDSRSAIGSTSFTEGLVCLVGFLAYVAAKGNIHWNLAIPLVIGAVASTPLAALTTKRIPSKTLKMTVGILITILGALTLIRTML